MQKFMIGVPFKAGHEIHVSTFQRFIQILSSPGSLVVYINVYTCEPCSLVFILCIVEFPFPNFLTKFLLHLHFL
jgi:hypothetical protein